ncbi:potassium voltage-gated channel subfamily S member 3a [Colossoma macropomum]|uniref:potassium voltage-gated channel subfamily S member 3a n=1 Tax=Colossoma macropomum TaxID=42526 RepID=UPI0018641D37|nr:potassium voltage-gated channel subfamily S member 3a [Colossoma macropomum]
MVYGQILHRRGPDDSFINLNVGGYKQKVARVVLQRFPHTRLGKLLCCHSEAAILELCDDYSAVEREYYFDRNPRFFCYVLNFYHTGKIHLMEELCVFSFSQELEYWGIKELHLDSCCSNKFQEQKENAGDRDWNEDEPQNHLHESFDSSMEELSALDKDLEKFEGTWCSEKRKQLWLRLENPAYSRSAKVLAVVSLSVVLISIVAMCVHSMPEFHKVDANEKPVEDPVLNIFETICIIWFTFEFIIRLAVTPCLRKFLSNTLNIIDFVSIVPFYATLAFDKVDPEESEELENVGKVVQILRLMRIFRILKLARHSVGLRSLGATLRHSYHEVGLLLLFLSVGISIFSVLIYFVEKEEDESELQTIPVGWWWATISMTTVGYGDTYPITLAGKLIGTLCIICGLLVVALPITIIFNKFSKYYQRQKALVESDQFGFEGKGPIPGIPFFNMKDLYAQGVNSLLASLSSRSSVASGGDATDASSIQDIETVCPAGLAETGEET